MMKLGGKISDRIRDKDSDIPREALTSKRIESIEEMPDIESIRHGGGRGLGAGAERRRNGGAS